MEIAPYELRRISEELSDISDELMNLMVRFASAIVV